jgi:TPR repeat protein
MILALGLLGWLPPPANAGEPTDSARQWCAQVDHWWRRGPKRKHLDALLDKDWKRMEPAVRKLATEGDAAANNALGVVLAIRRNGPDDPAESIKYWKRAAEAGSAVAMTNLSRTYLFGTNVDKQKAVSWCRRGAELGETYAMLYVGWCYGEGLGVPKSPEEAVRWYRKAAELGNAVAMNNLGVFYRDGRGVPQSSEKALEWFRKAAELGDLESMAEVGRFYMFGLAGRRSDKEALDWYRKAAALGYPPAMNNVGFLMQHGQGMPHSQEEALKWYRRAAEAGDKDGMYNLAVSYYSGNGVETSWKEAAKWFRKAVDQKYAKAMWKLGRMYCSGQGVPKMPGKGVALVKQAAELGYTPAMCDMARHCASGFGTKQSTEEAEKWFRRAIKAGHVHNREALKLLLETKHMDPVAVSKEATRIFEEKGAEQALDYLDNNAMPGNSPLLEPFWRAIWKEAQVRGGRKHIAWRADLYRWMYETYDANTPLSELSDARLGLLYEIVEATRQAGRIALSRHYVEIYRHAVEQRLHMALDPATLADQGPLDPAFPEIRIRDFPKRIKHNGNNFTYINYTHMYGVLGLQWQSWMQGDWKTSSDNATWLYRWADWVVENRKTVQPSWLNLSVARRARIDGLLGIVRVFDHLGFYGLSRKYALLVSVGDDKADSRGGLEAKRYIVRADLARGNASEKQLLILDTNVAMDRKNYDQVEDAWMTHVATKAEVLFQLGRDGEAWDELESIINGFAGKDVSLPKAEILMKWILHRLDAVKLDQVEERLREAVLICRKKGYKIHEPRLYSLYARYLFLIGETDEAIRMQIEAIRLFNALDLYTLVVLEYRTLARYYLAAGQPAEARRWLHYSRSILGNGRAYPDWIVAEARKPLEEQPAPPVAGNGGDRPGSRRNDDSPPVGKEPDLVILQPSEVDTSPLEGLPARSSFTLFNASSRKRQGVLRVTGPGAELGGDTESASCSFIPGEPGRTSDRNIVLLPNQSMMIECDTTGPPTLGAGVRIEYVEGTRKEAGATWRFMRTKDNRTVSMVDALLIDTNPFYMIPVVHRVQAAGSGLLVVNLRARASEPTRIEAYLPSGKPLFIDAEGNGSLADQGDVLFHDADQDGFGDISFKDDITDLPVTFYYQPLGNAAKLTVDLETRDREKWQFDSRDTIRTPTFAVPPSGGREGGANDDEHHRQQPSGAR